MVAQLRLNQAPHRVIRRGIFAHQDHFRQNDVLGDLVLLPATELAGRRPVGCGSRLVIMMVAVASSSVMHEGALLVTPIPNRLDHCRALLVIPVLL